MVEGGRTTAGLLLPARLFFWCSSTSSFPVCGSEKTGAGGGGGGVKEWGTGGMGEGRVGAGLVVWVGGGYLGQ